MCLLFLQEKRWLLKLVNEKKLDTLKCADLLEASAKQHGCGLNSREVRLIGLWRDIKKITTNKCIRR